MRTPQISCTEDSLRQPTSQIIFDRNIKRDLWRISNRKTCYFGLKRVTFLAIAYFIQKKIKILLGIRKENLSLLSSFPSKLLHLYHI